MSNNNNNKEKNMFKKTLLVTSAIAAAAILSTTAFAEMKISGKSEFAFQNTTRDSNDVRDQSSENVGKVIGQETVLKMSTSGDLDNGMGYFGSFNIDKGEVGNHEMGVSMEGVSVRFGSDTSGGTEKIKQITPMVNNRRADVYAGTRSADATKCYAGCDVDDVTSGENYVGIGFKHDLATFDYAYAPNLGEAKTRSTDAKGAGENAGSGSSWMLKGGFGVEGLTLAYGISTEKTIVDNAEDGDSKIYGAAYKYGQFSVGYQKSENEEGGVLAASRKTAETTDYSVTYSVNDQLSIGYLDSKTDYKSTPTTAAITTDAKVYQVGYSLGAMSLHATMAKADNAFATTGEDFSVYKLKAKLAF
jgi:hypothetical protein